MSLDTWAAKQLIGNLRVKVDPFGIYAQRMALSKVMPVQVYRGDEWWTAAADRIIQDGFDAKHVRTVPRELMEVLG